MNLDEAKIILHGCVRHELQDNAFGDAEVFWEKDGKEIASGYFGGSMADVSGETIGSFEGQDARQLRSCGTEGEIERNDETGPDTFTEGETMPGLSRGDVFHELTGSYLDES